MKSALRICLIFLLLINCNYLHSISNNDKNPELGNFPVKNYIPDEYNALPQIWSIVQDSRGIIYAGNRDGVLQYDGTIWKKILIGAELIGRSLCVGGDGRVFVGSENEFGYLVTNIHGSTEYKSLIPLMGSENADFGDIWKIFWIENSVIFQSTSKLFVYKNNKISIIKGSGAFANTFLVNKMLFVLDNENGLQRFNDDSLKLIENTKFLSSNNLFILLPYKHNVMYGVTDKSGAYLLNYLSERNSIKSFRKSTDIDDFIIENQIYSGIKIDDKKYSIGSFNGIKVIDDKGTFLYNIDRNNGIIDDNVKIQFIDNSGSLWLGLSNGISTVQVNSPITSFTDNHNINGTVEWITRFEGKIYIATSVGAYFLTENSHGYEFIQLPGIKQTETWISESYSVLGKDILLVEQNDIIYQTTTKNPVVIYKGIPWAIYQMKQQTNKFLIGVEDGVQIIEFENSKWRVGEKISGIETRIIDIIEDNEANLWFSAETEGIFRKPLSDNEVYFYNDSSLLPPGPYIFEMYNNQLLIGTAEGFYRYNYKTDSFYEDPQIGQIINNKNRYVHQMSVDYLNNLWAVTYIDGENHEMGFFDYDKDSNLFWNPTPFLGNIKGQINAIYHENDGITWLGGSEGLFRYDSKVDKNYRKDFSCLIRKVRLGEDSTYFYGDYYDENRIVSNIQPEELKPVLSYAYNSLIFDYSAMNIDVDNPTKYSYYLDGFDKKWSEWNSETKKEYTNLSEGEYTFRVKAKNIYNHESFQATFEFEILPPWYRTWWAYILIVLLAIAVVYLIVTQYTKYLRAVIKENTAEIREQKDEIEKQKDEITASIKYAVRIQRAIVPTKERALELLPEHFIMWRPRDIVSGDFWWMAEKNGLVAIAAADCTGHGVPGAFMSMLGIAFLNEIVAKSGIIQANLILDDLRMHVKTTLKQTGKEGESKDGMDIAMVVIDKENSQVQFAGAYNPLFLIRNGELIETKADRNPIGIYIKERPFSNNVVDIQKGDTLYTFSDGFPDQFGGENGGKYKTKNFKELLLKIQDKPMQEQHDILYKEVDNWRGEWEQVDDIIIVGLRF